MRNEGNYFVLNTDFAVSGLGRIAEFMCICPGAEILLHSFVLPLGLEPQPDGVQKPRGEKRGRTAERGEAK